MVSPPTHPPILDSHAHMYSPTHPPTFPLSTQWNDDYTVLSRGARNPFRNTVDPKTGDVYFGDVGSSVWEEINRIPNPLTNYDTVNFGWPCIEGSNSVSDIFQNVRRLPPTHPPTHPPTLSPLLSPLLFSLEGKNQQPPTHPPTEAALNPPFSPLPS